MAIQGFELFKRMWEGDKSLANKEFILEGSKDLKIKIAYNSLNGNELIALKDDFNIFHECVITCDKIQKYLTGYWNKIDTPVSFQEVLKNTDTKVKVEHKIIDNEILLGFDKSEEAIINEVTKDIKDNKFVSLDDLFLCLGWNLTPLEIQTVIKEGKWYIED